MQKLLAIIIIGKNESKTLPRVFDSIQNASKVFFDSFNEYPDVIYIDSDSNDGSIELAKKHGVRYKCIYGESNAARGRIEGVKEINSKYIFFLDGDTEVINDWLVEAVNAIEKDDKIAGVGGMLEFNYYKDDKLINKIENYWGTKRDYQKIYDGVGGTFLYRSDAYLKSGGFNNKYKVGEEFDLMLRVISLGYRVIRLSKKMAVHHDYKSLKESFYKRYLFTRNILITGRIIRGLRINKTTLNYLFRRFWLYFLHVLLILSVIFSLLLKEYSFSLILFLILILSHLIFKKFNIIRTVISLFTMNFYSIGLIFGMLKRN